MKISFTICICAVVLAVVAFGQNQGSAQATSASPATSVGPTPTATAEPATSIAASPVAGASVSSGLADKIQERIEKKFKKGGHIRIESDSDAAAADRHEVSEDIPELVVPIVAITMLTVFGAPVLIVGLIMLINYFKARSLHRTVQTMVEKGQPVPAALLAPPALPRARSDLRRGIILVMAGLGIGVFFLATDWGDSSWSLGAIPFLIGVGYLIVWKLEGKKRDNPPPFP